MGFGPFSSSSETKSDFRYSDSREAAADNASLISNRNSGKNGRQTIANAPFSVAVSGNGDNQIAFQVTDGGAFDLVNDVVHDTISAIAAGQAASLNAVADVNDKLESIAETKLTDGANLNQKTTIVALVVFGVIGLVAWLLLKK